MAGRLVPRVVLLAILVGALPLGTAGAATTDGSAGFVCSPQSHEPEVCLQVEGTPDTVSASRPGAPAYVLFTATVTNASDETVTDVELEIASLAADTSGGFVLSSAAPNVGMCSLDDHSATLTCSFGKLNSGAVAQVDLVLQAPSTPGEAPIHFTASFEECDDDWCDHEESDTISLTKVTTVTAPGETASSFVPEGTAVALDIDKEGQEGALTLAAQKFSTTAELQFTSTGEIPFECPSPFVCRGGNWLTATIPGTFDPAAEFDLFWPAELVSRRQTVRNFVVFYIPSPGAPVQIIKTRCDAHLSVIPCLKDVTKFKRGPLKGSFAATVVRVDNGHMR